MGELLFLLGVVGFHAGLYFLLRIRPRMPSMTCEVKRTVNAAYRPIRDLPDGKWLWWDYAAKEWKPETTDEHRSYREERCREASSSRADNRRLRTRAELVEDAALISRNEQEK